MKYVPDEELDKYDMVRKFLLNGGPGLGDKPILWIHTSHPINHRYWPSFGSRNTRLLNQPYKVACVETVVKYCSKSFNIVLIDDYSNRQSTNTHCYIKRQRAFLNKKLMLCRLLHQPM